MTSARARQHFRFKPGVVSRQLFLKRGVCLFPILQLILFK